MARSPKRKMRNSTEARLSQRARLEACYDLPELQTRNHCWRLGKRGIAVPGPGAWTIGKHGGLEQPASRID